MGLCLIQSVIIECCCLILNFIAVFSGMRDLPAECVDFTAGSCDPDENELVEIYPLPNLPRSNAICQVRLTKYCN
jgi:hypothetical protein